MVEIRHHPNNLLNGEESTKYKSSDGLKDGSGDWIIFRMDAETARLPLKVRVGNAGHKDGLRRIELSFGSDAETFHHSLIIDDIHSTWKLEEQEFDVSPSSYLFLMHQCKFIKLKVLQNWGRKCNEFHSFTLLG